MAWYYLMATFVAFAVAALAIRAISRLAKGRLGREAERDAVSIFDAREPLGQMTDRFPAARRQA